MNRVIFGVFYGGKTFNTSASECGRTGLMYDVIVAEI
jgi:hypothetical protein